MESQRPREGPDAHRHRGQAWAGRPLGLAGLKPFPARLQACPGPAQSRGKLNIVLTSPLNARHRCPRVPPGGPLLAPRCNKNHVGEEYTVMKFPRPHNCRFLLGITPPTPTVAQHGPLLLLSERTTHHCRALAICYRPETGTPLNYFPKFWSFRWMDFSITTYFSTTKCILLYM